MACLICKSRPHAAWRCKAIYRLNDEQVGQWSDVATIGVMG
jgi:hypothetical protein